MYNIQYLASLFAVLFYFAFLCSLVLCVVLITLRFFVVNCMILLFGAECSFAFYCFSVYLFAFSFYIVLLCASLHSFGPFCTLLLWFTLYSFASFCFALFRFALLFVTSCCLRCLTFPSYQSQRCSVQVTFHTSSDK